MRLNGQLGTYKTKLREIEHDDGLKSDTTN